jgi:phosphoenolpyruvate-protein phosphotransferase
MNIIETKKSAAFAWKVSYLSHANRLTQLTNELFAARATDLKDVGRRVLKILVGAVDQKIDFPEDAILIAESLTPSDTANLDKSKVLGFATTTGGATSHVAILARSLGIPAIAGINAKALDLQAGTQVILDGDSGVIKLNISESDIALIKSKQEAYDKEKTQALEKAFDVAKTTDGLEIEVAANIAGPSDAADALSLGCDGVGLLRSEFLFLERKSAPTEADQLQTYQKIAHALTDEKSARKFIIRTLDVGGDKPLAYMPIPEEENPFLGERGIRVSLNNPEIFREQLRAILRVKPIEQVRIMFPMISTITELKEAKKILKEEQDKLGVKKIEVGIMIEVPSAALMAEQLAAEVDFFSIGANDLTQYTLAMDRGHHKLAALADGLHPSILRLIKMTCDGAKKHGKWVGVCGGIASDLPAVPILIGLGVTELSVSVPVLPMVKAQVRKISHKDCSELAQKALNLETGKEVRELVSSFNS